MTEGVGEAPAPLRPAPSMRRVRVAIAVAVFGAVVTVLLTVSAWVVDQRNEDRLLRQRTREAAAVLRSALPGVQTPLSAGAELAESTRGDPAAFSRLMTPYIENGRFDSAVLWRRGDPRPVTTVGQGSALEALASSTIQTELERALGTATFTVIRLFDRIEPRLGYAYTSPSPSARFIVYTESALADRRQQIQRDSAFQGLDFAMYVGAQENESDLLSASVRDLPVSGRRASESIPFGDTELLLVMTPKGQLGGALLQALPWIIVATGAVLTAMATLIMHHLVTARGRAETLAAQIQSLYHSQRSISLTLQRSLLPRVLPPISGIELAARYEAGVQEMEVGGDWYDVVPLSDDRFLVVVGDVSGRGVDAASAMAALRYSTRAYAREGHTPAAILQRLTDVLDVEQDGCFATVLCMQIDVRDRRIRIANAGHPDPVLVESGIARSLDTIVGPPIGVTRTAAYETQEFYTSGTATLLAFTDGLFERRGESLDVGLERVRRTAERPTDDLEALVFLLVGELAVNGADDTAVIGVRWKESTSGRARRGIAPSSNTAR